MKNRILTLIATSLSWVIGALLIATDSIASSVVEELGFQDGFPGSQAEDLTAEKRNRSPK